MPKSLPAALVIQKNKVSSTAPWLILLEIDLVNPTTGAVDQTTRLAHNQENVVWNGNTYWAFPFTLDQSNDNSNGEIPKLTLSVSNVTQLLQADVEQYSGGMGSTVTLTVVHTGSLDSVSPEMQRQYEVLSCTSTADMIAFDLGAPNPMRRRFPLNRYMPGHCYWPYKGAECRYSGSSSACSRTYNDCVAHGMQANFGGFVGLQAGGIRVI